MSYFRRRLLFASLLLPTMVWGQTTSYHLHKEASTIATSFDKLLSTGPDAASTAFTAALKSKAAGEYVIKEFETQAGIPSAAGVVPNGSTLTFNLWMRKTANVGTVFPRAKVRLNSATGTLFCTATATSALTTTVTHLAFSCATSADIPMAAADRFYLWVGVNLTGTSTSTFNGELDVEGTLSGNFDSQITLPLATGVPLVTGVTPNQGAINSSIVISGSNFRSGVLPGSTVKVNGIATTPSVWATNSITAPVPAGVPTGNTLVTVTVGGQTSTGSSFSVVPAPIIASLSPPLLRSGQPSPLPGQTSMPRAQAAR
jgi:hypothetical protein